MRKIKYILLLAPAWSILGFLAPYSAFADNATLRLGFIYLDEIGGVASQQQSFNLYEGASVSLEKISYRFENGARLSGNLRNITLNDRNLYGRLTKSGKYNLTLAHNKYRRKYSFEGDKFTRRTQSSTTAWYRPHRYIRIFGGYGVTDKKGQAIRFFEPGVATPSEPVNYKNNHYHVGAQANARRHLIGLEFRGSSYDNDLDINDTRTTKRYKMWISSPITKSESIFLNGGIQRFVHENNREGLELSSNTVWGGIRGFTDDGFSLKYSFIFDRSSDDSDIVAIDQITNAIYVGKTWIAKGAVTVGYQQSVNDDFEDQLKTDGYYAFGWIKLKKNLKFSGKLGSERRDVSEGATLTGNEDRDRYMLSAIYSSGSDRLRAEYKSKNTENKDIGSSADYSRASVDLTLAREKLGQASLAYSYSRGDYKNSDENFLFSDHSITGDLLSRWNHDMQFGVSGFYYRSSRDVDVESISLRLIGRFLVSSESNWILEVIYDARNFDDFLALDQYYTANIVEINLSKDLKL